MIRPDDPMLEPEIASPSNPRIKAAVRLRDRRERDRTGLTLIDGARELRRALDAGVTVDEAFVYPALVRSDDARSALDALQARATSITTVSETALTKVAFGERLDGIVAVVHAPSTDLKLLGLAPDPLVVVLEGVEKPGNVGAVIRSADGAGASAVVVADPRTDMFNPNAIRASIGTIFSMPAAADTTPQVRAWLTTHNVRAIAARPDATTLPWEVDLTGPLAIVLGSEAQGLGARWADEEIVGVRIPMLGAADSLNVSVAAAVLLYEARRQRG